MRISYHWLEQFITLDKTPEELSLILTGIGLEVESLEKVQAIPGGLDGMVIGQVKTCVPHPNADRLRVTTVDIGQEEPLPIVCGAPNVAAGQKVIVATVGATVYPIGGEPFKIGKSKIRGEVSEGMICAEDEIGLGHSHEGIMVLPETAVVGTPAAAFFNLKDDYVFEIGLTPNRADAASHLGVARDIAAYLDIPFGLPALEAAGLPERQEAEQQAPPVGNVYPVRVESPACLRYASCLIKGVKIQESPDWLKEKLAAIGLRPINNVVDITNYVLHGLGQPLHAFDASKIQGVEVVVRTARAGEKFVTLDGIERSLHPDDLLICDVQQPMCIAGVFGGIGSGVSETTSEIFLESAYFDAVSVRKTSKRHGLKTDASFRFERGTDPDMPVFALRYAAGLITEIAGGEIATPVSDIYPDPVEPFVFEVNCGRVQRLIGEPIPQDKIRSILLALGIRILSETGDTFQVAVPPYKVDVTREVDVIEEVLRIYGYDNIVIGSQLRASLNPFPKPDRETVQNQIADLLVANGYFEIMNNSLGKLENAVDPETAVRILNPLSSDLDTMRQHLVFSLLETVSYNQKRKQADLRIFEFGKSYHLDADKYSERYHLALALTGRQSQGNWGQKDEPVSFYHLKAAVETVLKRLGIRDMQISDADHAYLSDGLSYVRNQTVLVSFGALNKKALDQADVAGQVFYADFDWDAILKAIRKNKTVHQEVPKFPAVRRDLALLVDQEVSFETLRGIAVRTDRKLLKEINVFDVYRGDKLPEGKKSYALSFVIQDEEKTLADKQIDAVVNKLIYNFEKEAGAEVRK